MRLGSGKGLRAGEQHHWLTPAASCLGDKLRVVVLDVRSAEAQRVQQLMDGNAHQVINITRCADAKVLRGKVRARNGRAAVAIHRAVASPRDGALHIGTCRDIKDDISVGNACCLVGIRYCVLPPAEVGGARNNEVPDDGHYAEKAREDSGGARQYNVPKHRTVGVGEDSIGRAACSCPVEHWARPRGRGAVLGGVVEVSRAEGDADGGRGGGAEGAVGRVPGVALRRHEGRQGLSRPLRTAPTHRTRPKHLDVLPAGRVDWVIGAVHVVNGPLHGGTVVRAVVRVDVRRGALGGGAGDGGRSEEREKENAAHSEVKRSGCNGKMNC